MALSAQVVVGTSPTKIVSEETSDGAHGALPASHGGEQVNSSQPLLVESSVDGYEVRLENVGGSSVFIGGSAVTTTTGYELKAAGTMILDLSSADPTIYGVVASGTVTVDVLAVLRGN